MSGVGAWHALSSRTAGEYLWERVKRLLIPLYTVGLLILLPPQFYSDELTNSGYGGSFAEIIPRYFARLGLPHLPKRPTTLLPVPFSGQLWFLQDLFLISLISLPLFLWLKKDQGQRWIGTRAGWCERRCDVFVFLVPLTVALVAFEAQKSWAELVWYAIYFITCYIIPADKRFAGAFVRYGSACVVLWPATFLGEIALVKVFGYAPFGRQPLSVMYVLFQILWSISSWSAVMVTLTIGARYLKSRGRWLNYGNGALLPFYLFHQTVILCVGFFFVPSGMDIPLKFIVIAAASFPLTFGLYELLVRPFNPMRFFFGMGPKKGPPTSCR